MWHGYSRLNGQPSPRKRANRRLPPGSLNDMNAAERDAAFPALTHPTCKRGCGPRTTGPGADLVD